VQLPFLDREQELKRIARALADPKGALVCVYGRRRLGKSRLVRRAIQGRRAVYYVGDDRDAAVQRAALAREMARLVPRFESVAYSDWETLLERWWHDAPPQAVLAIDELPSVVATAPELPSLFQKLLDRGQPRGRHLVLCGSSQSMMQGLVLDATGPLYGRAREILRLGPLSPAYLGRALRSKNAADVVERYCVWGGVPRYWELALDYKDLFSAVEELVLDPLGVLHDEPARLLRDDVRDPARAASILSLIGQGSHRLSEIAGRLGVPAPQLSRPMARLVDLGLIVRETPFGTSARDSKRSLYRIADPLLDFCYTFVDPNRSRLGARQIREVRREIEKRWPPFLGLRWEQLARDRVAAGPVLGTRWKPAARWWGPGAHGAPLEIDIVAEAANDPERILVGEAKLACKPGEVSSRLASLKQKAAACPALAGRQIEPVLWILCGDRGLARQARVLLAQDVVNPQDERR
jgi:AAA+ ATPase superfamily predicted ATPase